MPEFLPVDVINEENTAMLSVNDARCDGYYVTLDLELQVWDPSMAQCYLLSPCSNPMDPASNEATLILMDSQQAEPLSEQNDFSFQLAGSGNTDSTVFSATWKFRLPQELSHGEGFSGSLEIGTLSGLQEGSDQVFSFPVSLSVVFDSYADLRDTFVYQQPISDNGIVLNQVVVTPSAVVTQQTVPYFGTLESTLLTTYDSVAGMHTLLGCYPVLTTQDGTLLEKTDSPVGNSTQPLEPYTSSDQAQGAFTFEAPPEGTTQLVLTLYEYPTSFNWQSSEIPKANRVTGEFTIDLARNTVYASQNYLLEGRNKLDHTLSPSLVRTPSPKNGFICGPVNQSGNYAYVTLYIKQEDYDPNRPISLRCYVTGILLDTYSTVGEDQLIVQDDGSYFYQGENYTFSRTSLVDPDPTGSGPYEALSFQIWNLPDGLELSPDQLVFSLVDQDTGTLVEDIALAYCNEIDSIVGTQSTEAYLSGSMTSVDPSPAPSSEETQSVESNP